MIKQISLKKTNYIFKNTELDTELFEVYKYGTHNYIVDIKRID